MLLYHGTINTYADGIFANGVSLDKSKPHLDFGPGFYTTPDKNFAIRTSEWHAKKYNAFHRGKSVQVVGRILIFDCDEKKLERMNQKLFVTANAEWAQFILANRCSDADISERYDNNLHGKYDVVFGPTADGSKGELTSTIDRIDKGELRIEEVNYPLFAPSNNGLWGIQISFHTARSLSCIQLQDML